MGHNNRLFHEIACARRQTDTRMSQWPSWLPACIICISSDNWIYAFAESVAETFGIYY